MVLSIKKNDNIKDNEILYKSFSGTLIKRGNVILANKILVKTLEHLKLNNKFKGNPKLFFLENMVKIKPSIGLRIKKVAGISYQLPCPISDERSSKIVIKWFFSSIKSRNEKKLFDRIINEISDLIKQKGLTINKKNSFEKIALDNRVFLYFLKR